MRVLSLFAGVGGFDLGLERAGMTTVGQVEIDPFCRKVLEKYWLNVWRHDDVRTCTAELVRANCGDIDLICGGPPCQPASRLGSNDERWMWPEYFRLLREVRPRYALMENPTGIFDGWFGDILGSLATLGYDAEWECISAAAFGAPHLRDRVFIVAHTEGESIFQLSEIPLVTPSQRQSRPWEYAESLGSPASPYREANRLVDAVREGALPFVCGGHDGIPLGLDGRNRCKALGNAVVPQIAEWIGRKIMDSPNPPAEAAPSHR